MNATHDPGLRSWVVSANDGVTDFPIQNLPHGVFRRRGSGESWRGGVAIGNQVLDLGAALALNAFEPASIEAATAASASRLNGLMALGPRAWTALRADLSRLLRADSSLAAPLGRCLVPQQAVEHTLPAQIGDYTDFFTSWHHMLNAGRIFRPDAPPLPNFKWLPIAYHGRASSVEVSGAAVYRPQGQTLAPGASEPGFGLTQRLDYELELAFWVGPGNPRGHSILADDAEQHIFGMSLLNDWSARDVQSWEALPLGPFLAKNFLSTVSPWIVTLEALEPYRCALPRSAEDPPTLPNLQLTQTLPGYDLQLEAQLHTARSGDLAMRLSRSSFRHCHWAITQMLAHHTEGGCNLRAGDLIGTGTQSGPLPGEQGCLLELSQGGRQPLVLGNGETRSFLEDGDTVVLRAWAERPGAVRVGFGDCRGTVLSMPAR
jgi:fumarylacetoacetase